MKKTQFGKKYLLTLNVSIFRPSSVHLSYEKDDERNRMNGS